MKTMKSLDDFFHTFVIAEAGSNWKIGSDEENLRMARSLIQTAAKAGADAVKFQTFSAKKLYAQNAGQAKYLTDTGEKRDINELISDLAMPYETLEKLVQYCKAENIMFMSSVFSVDDAREVDKYVDIHKIASYEINHIELLEFLAKTGKSILISTGASTIDEIDFALNVLKKNNQTHFALLQCTSKYPSPFDSMNISVIPKLKARYGIPVGLSDHSIDPLIAPLLAIGMGASIIEKHFTMDKNLPGPDHSFALNPDELRKMIQAIREADKAKGNGEKLILDVEKELSVFAKRSVQAIRNIAKGEILEQGVNFDVLRPGNQKRGIEPRFVEKILGKKAKKEISIGEGILLEDCYD